MPPEIVVQTKARPSAANAMPSGTWPSLSCANVVGLAVLEAADAMRHRLGPVEPALGVEGDAVGVDVRPLEHQLAVAGGVHDVQPAGLALRIAVVALGAGVGEPEPAVGPEGEIVRAGQRMPGDRSRRAARRCRRR